MLNVFNSLILFILRFTILLIVLSFSHVSYAQLENSNWHFSIGHSFRFTGGDAPVHEASNMRTFESCSSVSDYEGDLLFYTMGSRVWDKNGDEMPNSVGLLGNGPHPPVTPPYGSCFGGVQLIMNPANHNQYYVFSMDPGEIALEDRKVFYHIVDMTLNDGLGDILPSHKNTVIMEQNSEYSYVLRGDDCKTFWLLIQKHTSPSPGRTFYAFKIDESGVHDPVISVLPPFPYLSSTVYPAALKQLNDSILISPVQNMVPLLTGILFTHFDKTTGILSDDDYMELPLSPYQLELSLNKKVLFCVAGQNLYKYDVFHYPDKELIQDSETLVYSFGSGLGITHNVNDIRTAPNGNIFLARSIFGLATLDGSLDYIKGDDDLFTTFNYVESFSDYYPSWVDAPMIVFRYGEPAYIPRYDDTVITPMIHQTVCFDPKIELYSGIEGADTYEWFNGSHASKIEVSEGGTYWVKSFKDCVVYIDSFNVKFSMPDFEFPDKFIICEDESLIVDLFHPDVESYLWDNGSMDSDRIITDEGTYSFEVVIDECTIKKSFYAERVIPAVYISPGDTSICESRWIELECHSNLESEYKWSTGETSEIIIPYETGLYSVTALNVCGLQTDSVYITISDCNCQFLIPNAFSPNGDGLNDVFRINLSNFCLLENFRVEVFNRYGETAFIAFDLDNGWDGTYHGRHADAGVYFYVISYFDALTQKMKFQRGDITLLR